ncbi:hypothetical protein [Novosphingobium soli]|uniref:DUF2946 domain-containing protein n=1 Tax=Novosphingobium soli TaxID=574956 RepID=A0ABV6CSG1_9SPHN
MATAAETRAGDKAGRGPGRVGQPSRWKRNLVLVLVLVLAGGLAWAWQGLREEALVGGSYGAQVGCVCRFVSARPLASCEADLAAAQMKGAARLVSLSEATGRRSITASVPLLASQSADFDPRRGCRVQPWQD